MNQIRTIKYPRQGPPSFKCSFGRGPEGMPLVLTIITVGEDRYRLPRYHTSFDIDETRNPTPEEEKLPEVICVPVFLAKEEPHWEPDPGSEYPNMMQAVAPVRHYGATKGTSGWYFLFAPGWEQTHIGFAYLNEGGIWNRKDILIRGQCTP